MKLIDLFAAFGNNAGQVGSTMFCNRNPLLALLLAATLIAVQTGLPWMHVGCQHDHSGVHGFAATAGHQHCRGHHHLHPAPAQPQAEGVDQGQKHQSTDDCAACRFLLLSSVACESAAICLSEQVSLLSNLPPVTIAANEPVGLYRSRAPPALS